DRRARLPEHLDVRPRIARARPRPLLRYRDLQSRARGAAGTGLSGTELAEPARLLPDLAAVRGAEFLSRARVLARARHRSVHCRRAPRGGRLAAACSGRLVSGGDVLRDLGPELVPYGRGTHHDLYLARSAAGAGGHPDRT